MLAGAGALLFLGLIGLLLGAALASLFKKREYAVGTGCLTAIVFPFAFFGVLALVNALKPHESHWEEELGYPPPKSIVITASEVGDGFDYHERAFWFNTNASVLEEFANHENFLVTNKKGDPTAVYWLGERPVSFSQNCTYTIEYESPDYFERHPTVLSRGHAYLKYCPETGESLLTIFALD